MAHPVKITGKLQGVVRVGGRVLIITSAAADAYRIYTADDKIRETVKVAGRWAVIAGAVSAYNLATRPSNAAGPPLGVWKTDSGTATQMFRHKLCINANSTETLDTFSALKGEERAPIVWRHIAPGVLHIIEFFADNSTTDITDDMWEIIEYEAVWSSTDTADKNPALRSLYSDTFWTLAGPLLLVARSEL